MYHSYPPMSATDKAPDIEEDDDTSIHDHDLVDASEAPLVLDNLEPDESTSSEPRKRSRVISDDDEADDPAVAVQGSDAAPLPVAPLRIAPPLPKRQRRGFGFDLDVSS